MLVQQGKGGLTVDFIDEDELTESSLSRFKAVVVTEPAIPIEGLSALAEYVKSGGHLLTVTSAGTRDRLNASSSVLSSVTGFVEEPRVQECFHYGGKYQTSVNVANGNPPLKPISLCNRQVGQSAILND